MKYKPMARLLVKLVGLSIICGGIQSLLANLGQLGAMILMIFDQRLTNLELFWVGNAMSAVGSCLTIALGLYLFFGGKWIVNLAIPGSHPHCPECAYDLTGAASTRCPECGTPFRWEDVMPGKGSTNPEDMPAPIASRDESIAPQ